MNAMFCRAFQCCFAVGARFLPWRTPEVFSGEGSLLRAADILRENGLRRPFVIASRRQCADEHFRALQEKLDEQDILLSIFSSVEPNPSVETVENIAAQYKIDSCDCFLVIGGGSPMDAAKAAAARLARPDKPLSQLVGLLKVRRRIPPLIAVPTTAGTGSETTIAAVVTGSDHHKYAISDLCLIPRYAILDPALTVGLPPHITAETGMDALTHAVEAYLSRFYNTKQTRLLAEHAVVAIFTHLERAYRDGTSLPDRAAMLREIAHTVGWHMAQVTAQDYRLFAHAALWTEAEVLQAWDDVCFDAWFYHETTPPWNPPELPAGPLSEIGELGRGFRMALFDADSGLFVYVEQFG